MTIPEPLRPFAGRATLALFVLALWGFAGRADEPPKPVAGPDKPYRPAEEVSGELRVVGSTPLSHLAGLWGTGLRRFHPKLSTVVNCDGAETALPELSPDRPVVGALARPLTAEELSKLEKRFGCRVLAITVCEDPIAVIVHKDNPVTALTLAQLRLLFGSDKGDKAELVWGRVGLTGEWAERPVELHGRDSSTGAHTFFRERMLDRDREDRPRKDHPSNSAIAKAVAEQKGAVGYCRLSQAVGGVKAIPLVRSDEEARQPPERERAFRGAYPLRRQLSLVVAVAADKPLPPLQREFLLYALSREGQQDVSADGFTPLSRAALREQFERLGISSVK